MGGLSPTDAIYLWRPVWPWTFAAEGREFAARDMVPALVRRFHGAFERATDAGNRWLWDRAESRLIRCLFPWDRRYLIGPRTQDPYCAYLRLSIAERDAALTEFFKRDGLALPPRPPDGSRHHGSE